MNNCRTRAAVSCCARWTAAAILSGFLSAGAGAEDQRRDYLVFLDASTQHRSGSPVGDEIKRNEGEAKATFLYSWQDDRYRFFGEAHAADEGEYELARLQWGWRLAPQTTAWVGRFHNPQGYWNTQYHHGAYLQTTIRRPGIEAFDGHEGGVLPSHFIGAQLDGVRQADQEGSLRYELGLGVSGQLDGEGLESPLIVGPQRSAKSTASLRLTYNPQEGGLDSFGLFVGRNQIPAKELDFREVRQTVAGVSVNKVVENLRFVGAVFFLRNELEGGATSGTAGGFASAYLQAEYQWNALWTPYARAEGTRGADDDAYLMLFHHFVKGRGLAGVRRDFGKKQALKLEFARSRIEAGRYNETGIQWSMVFP
ncbi:MAG: hypothetical protein NUV55_05600 [Sulfuricaulis sp.]|uniref:hypothetical protein n=1 Tax=Sulfuricaulis sp. TaxID=2003553 RepID=UPI0025E7A458|nr:hypothetical protein [Sulfuricaulis sp.]MCR4346660.1 hypothetical protein [Sulfuricaulis sp.]